MHGRLQAIFSLALKSSTAKHRKRDGIAMNNARIVEQDILEWPAPTLQNWWIKGVYASMQSLTSMAMYKNSQRAIDSTQPSLSRSMIFIQDWIPSQKDHQTKIKSWPQN